MSNFVFYSSDYLIDQLKEDNPTSYLCDGHCKEQNPFNPTHLLFSDSLKNLFRSFKNHFIGVADSDLHSLYLYTLLTLWPFMQTNGSKKDSQMVLVDSFGVELKMKGKMAKYRRQLSKEVQKIEKKLTEEAVVKHYCEKLETLPSLYQLALRISQEQEVSFHKAKRLADMVSLFFKHTFLPHEKDNEENSFNFYMRHKIPTNDEITLVYNQSSDLTLSSPFTHSNRFTLCDCQRRAG